MALLRTGPTRTQLMDALEKARRRPTTPVTGGLGEAMARMATQWVDAFSDRDTANRQVSEREAKNNAISRILQQAMMAGAGPVGRVTDATQVQAMPEYAGQSLANAMSSPQAQQTNQINFDGGQPINTDFGSPLAVGPTRRQILASNPATAELAFQMQMNKEEADAALQRQIAFANKTAKPDPVVARREAKVNNYMELYSITRAEAISLVDNLSYIDPITGILRSKIPPPDNQGGGGDPVIDPPGPIDPPDPSETNEYTPNVIALGTGFIDGMKAILESGSLTSWLVDGTEQVQAQAILNAIGKDIEKAFSVNTRYAVAEMDDIRAKLTPGSGMWKSKDGTIATFLGLEKALIGRLEAANADINDPTIDKAIKRDARIFRRAITSLRSNIGKMLNVDKHPIINTLAQLKELEKGALFRDGATGKIREYFPQGN